MRRKAPLSDEPDFLHRLCDPDDRRDYYLFRLRVVVAEIGSERLRTILKENQCRHIGELPTPIIAREVFRFEDRRAKLLTRLEWAGRKAGDRVVQAYEAALAEDRAGHRV